jgi:hypothetical protein
MDNIAQTRWSRAGRRALGIAALLVATLSLSACGAGVGDSPESQLQSSVETVSLKILTTSVPAGSSGVAYTPIELSTAGAQGPVTWSVADGDLPPGMDLTEGGLLVGQPSTPGFYEFAARATDGVANDEQTLAVAVDRFGVTVVSGLTFGDAWSGNPVHLRAAGFVGPMDFQVVTNESGGRLDLTDGTAGTSAYVPGNRPGTDLIRITDTANDQQVEIELNVTANPVEGHVARFGSSDVWYLDMDAKVGAHPYASDLHAATARLGLRSPDATHGKGSPTDNVADLLVRVEILRRLNQMYLRNADGSAGAAGLAISFPLTRPGAGYASPTAGGYVLARTNQYSVMCVCDQQGNLSALGMAIGDGASNPGSENNSPGSGRGQLGVFINYIAETVERIYRLHSDTLRREPIDSSDLPALKALLYGLPSPGGRYDLLRYHVEALAQSVAAIVAHEVGHSVGLDHTENYIRGSIMNTVAILGPGTVHFFLPADLARLQLALPGPSRGGVTSSKVSTGSSVAALSTPEGGIHVCSGNCQGGQ